MFKCFQSQPPTPPLPPQYLRLEESDDLKVKIQLATWFFKRLNIKKKKPDVLIFNRSYLLLLEERSGPLFPSFNIYAN